jgi:two-component system probable response regulator PhcQ
MEFFIVQSERDGLLREKLSTLHNVMLTDRILSLGVLATGLSHHIRNSMVAVKTFLDLAPQKMKEENLDLEQLRNPDFWRDYYQKVQGQMDKVVHLLSDLWETSEKPAAGFNDKVKIFDAVEKAISAVRPELDPKKIQVENRIPKDLPELKVDGKKFDRLFEMLLKEEAASLGVGGKVQLTASVIGAPGGPAEVQVELQDNGPGLSKDALRSIFDPFFVRSGNPQEYGIYLMSCFFIVYHHGGRISAQSVEGKGNSFTLVLPLEPAAKMPLGNEKDLISKSLINESLWEKLLAEN